MNLAGNSCPCKGSTEPQAWAGRGSTEPQSCAGVGGGEHGAPVPCRRSGVAGRTESTHVGKPHLCRTGQPGTEPTPVVPAAPWWGRGVTPSDVLKPRSARTLSTESQVKDPPGEAGRHHTGGQSLGGGGFVTRTQAVCCGGVFPSTRQILRCPTWRN